MDDYRDVERKDRQIKDNLLLEIRDILSLNSSSDAKMSSIRKAMDSQEERLFIRLWSKRKVVKRRPLTAAQVERRQEDQAKLFAEAFDELQNNLEKAFNRVVKL